MARVLKRLGVLTSVRAYPPHHNAGAEWSIHTMLRALVERGHTATVCLSQSPPVSDAYVLDGVTVVPSGARPRMGEAARSRRHA